MFLVMDILKIVFDIDYLKYNVKLDVEFNRDIENDFYVKNY